jgi:hypothetical protein
MPMRNVAFLTPILPLLTGCASIASSIVDSAADSIECHNKCPGGAPKAEKECREKCMAELNAKHARERRDKEAAEAKIKAWEWEETKRRQIKAMNKHQRRILE